MLRQLDLTSIYTGTPYLGGMTSTFTGNETSTLSSSVHLAFPGEEVILDVPFNAYQNFVFSEPVAETMGNDLIGFALLITFFGFLTSTITDYRVTYVPPKLPKSIKLPDAVFPSVSFSPMPITEAEGLRAVSGLDVEQLAGIFSVSRTTYHKWINGARPHRRHREHLLEVHSLVEKAAQRLGSQSAVTSWLLTPISATGKKPIEYLATHQYSEFRGFLLQVRSGREVIRSLTPSNRVHRELSHEEATHTLERLRPKARVEEDDR